MKYTDKNNLIEDMVLDEIFGDTEHQDIPDNVDYLSIRSNNTEVFDHRQFGYVSLVCGYELKWMYYGGKRRRVKGL